MCCACVTVWNTHSAEAPTSLQVGKGPRVGGLGLGRAGEGCLESGSRCPGNRAQKEACAAAMVVPWQQCTKHWPTYTPPPRSLLGGAGPSGLLGGRVPSLWGSGPWKTWASTWSPP